jgi:plasmid maintenance system antidote protein VapI
MNLQKNYDLWLAENTSKEWQAVKPISHELIHSHSNY